MPPKSYRHNAVLNRFSSRFSTSRTNGPRSLSRAKVGTHSAFGERSHTRAYTAKQGPSGRGRYHYPRTVSHVAETLRGQGVERQTLPLLGLDPVCSRRTQRAFGAAMRLCASLFRRRRVPAGLRDLFCFCRNCGFYALRSGLSARAKEGVVSLPSACSVCCRNAGRPLVKMAHLLFSCGQVIIFASSDRTAYKQKYHVRQQAEAQGAYFKYSSKNAFSFPNGMTSI